MSGRECLDCGDPIGGPEPGFCQPCATLGLSDRAVARLRAAGWTPAQWARKWSSEDGRWYGDSCGCPDDRCADVRYHHDPADMCGCLDALLTDLEWLNLMADGPTPDTARP